MRRFAFGCLALFGCGYNATILETRSALDEHNPEAALYRIDQGLGVASPTELPRSLDGDKALLVLQRASLLQALGRYEDSRRDFAAADTALDELDVSRSRRVRQTMKLVGFIGTSAERGGKVVSVKELAEVCNAESPTLEYEASPTERALLTTLNVANWLALGDARGAVVEARRLEVAARFAHDHGDVTTEKTIAFGETLGAFAAERADGASESELVVLFARGRAPAKSFANAAPSEVEAKIGGAVSPEILALGKKRIAQEAAAHPTVYGVGQSTTTRVPTLSPEEPGAGELTVDGERVAPQWTLDVAAAITDEWARVEKRHLAACYVCGCPSADLRGWETLPATLGVVRAKLAPGKHVVEGGRVPITIDLAPGEWKTIVVTAR